MTGVRILVEFTADGHPMGSAVPHPAGQTLELAARVSGTGPLDFVEIEFTDEPASAGQFYYLRVRQDDGNRAWASPIWLD